MDNVSLPVDVIDTSEVSIVDVQIDNEMKREVTDIGGNVDDTVGVKVLWSVDNSDLREFQVITDNNDKTLTDDPGKPLSLHDHVIEQALIRRDHHDDHIAGNGLHIVVEENIAESAIIGHHGNRLLAGDDSFSGDGISTRGGVPSSVVLSTETGMRVEEGHMLHVPDTDHSLLADSSSSMQVASSLASALTAQVDQDVIQLLLPSNGDHSSVGQAISISMGTSVDNTMTVSPPVHTLQSITFSDGSTAFIQHPTKFLEGQTITLDDGSTAVVQGLPGKYQPMHLHVQFRSPKHKPQFAITASVKASIPNVAAMNRATVNMSSAAIATSVGTDGNNVTTADTQTVQLEDGTTGFLNQAVKDGLQAIVLEDGTTAYLATQQTPQFMENATLEATTFTLDQLTSQMPGMQALIPNTMINMDIKPQLVSPQTVISNIVEQQNKNIQMSTDMPNTLYVTSATPSDKSLAFGEKAYRCNYEGCGRLYTTMHHLKVHERSHTGDRPFRCEFADCEKAFATGYGLKSHTRVHTGEKPYKCPEDSCDKGFKTSGDLQKHVRTHTGERPFKCPFEGCTRSFTTSNIRKVHIRTHTGERPYVCPEDNCGRAFASATNYKNHVRIHTGEKPYICTVQGCGKRFTEYSSLYKHHVVHTHSKPYNCNRCGKTYRQTSTLAMHKRTAHGEDTTAETEAALFVGQEGYEPAGKRPRLNFTLMPEATPDEGEGTLIINTSEPTQQLTLVDSENLGSVIAGATDPLGGIAANNQSSLLRNAGVATFTLGDQGQQVYVITDPAQLEALQQIAQQHLDSETAKDSGSCVTAPPGEIMKQEPGVATMDSGNSVVINNGNMTVNGCSIAMNTDNPETNSICEAAT